MIWKVGACFGARIILMLALASFILTARANPNVVAWGAGTVDNPSSVNDRGQSIVPVNLTNAVEVASGWWQSVAVKADGTLQGWGDDSLGELDFPAGSNYVAIACGDQHSLALKTDGTVVVAASSPTYGEGDIPVNLSNVVAVASGYYHCLALKSDGTVAAWGGLGAVDYGQGTVPNGLSNVVAIAAGGYHNLVLKSDGTLFAWGDNEDGETTIPPGLGNVVAVAAGAYFSLALRANGTVAAWGYNSSGQTQVPAGLSNVVAVVAKENHSLALQANGSVVGWGLDTEGDTMVPAHLTNVQQIAVGDVNSLVLIGTGLPVTRALSVQPNFSTNGFNFRLHTQNGRVYQPEFNNVVSGGGWQTLPLVAGTGVAHWFNDPAPTITQRYYRVLRW
ncbi:MAG TPA: hypothetical protein VNX46_01765 [Candidatus Acidoferrum sp.]|nr:hypothetical protein [Candidatus Acidoferrum sp.]